MGNTVSTDENGVPAAPRNIVSLSSSVQISTDLDVDYLISIAEKAGQAIMDIYKGDAANWDVDHKADDSPLTRADKEANKIICDALMDWTPHIPIISEENKVAPFLTRQKYQYCWIVDPLDGTKEFIKRVPHFTVNIALIKDKSPVMGVVCTPAAATMHFAVKGKGAFVRTLTSDDRQIRCKEYIPEAEGLSIVASASHMNSLTKDFMAMHKNPSPVQVGSSLKFLLVAEGLAHVYPRLAPTCEWDTAAAHIIVEEAGGSVVQAGLCDNKGNALETWQEALAKELPVSYNKDNILNPFFVVYGSRKGQ